MDLTRTRTGWGGMLLAVLTVGSLVSAQATPRAGTWIENTAEIAAIDSTAPDSGLSNTVRVEVDAIEAFDLTADHDTTAGPGASVTLTHHLVHHGNAVTRFLVTLDQGADDDFDLLDPTLLDATPEAGPGKPSPSLTVSLEPGEARTLRVVARVPDALLAGSRATLRIAATSQSTGARIVNTDAVEVVAAPSVQLLKTASDPSPNPGERYHYTLSLSNTGTGPIGGTSILVDGDPETVVLIRDAMPGGVVFDGVVTPAGGSTLYHLAGDATNEFRARAPSDLAAVDEIGFGFDALEPGESVTVAFRVQVRPEARGTIDNVAEAWFTTDAGGTGGVAPSNPVVLRVPIAPPEITYFTDGTFSEPARTGMPGDPLFLEAIAPACPQDPEVRDRITLTLRSRITGDAEAVTGVETGPATGRYRVEPPVPTRDGTAAAVVAGNGVLEIVANDVAIAGLAACDPYGAVDTELIIDPSGIVFDSADGLPVPGAVVRLTLADGSPVALDGGRGPLPAAATTSDGRFRFPPLPRGRYRVAVDPPGGYSYPSRVAPDRLPGDRTVEPDGSYGGILEIPGPFGVVAFDVPVDRAPERGTLTVEKRADRETVEIGAVAGYAIVVRNTGAEPASPVVVDDVMPRGFDYLDGSARQDGGRLAEPAGRGGPKLTFDLGTVEAGGTVTLTYRARVGAGAVPGRALNRARARRISVEPDTSATAAAVIRVVPGAFDPRGYVLGSVFLDVDRDGRRGPDEPGIPGVRLRLEDGTFTRTDGEGRYSFYGVRPATHVLSIDRVSLPADLRAAAAGSRAAGRGTSRFVDLKRHAVHRADFPMVGDPARLSPVLSARRRAAAEDGLDGLVDGGLRPDGVPEVRDERTLPVTGVVDARGRVRESEPLPLDYGLDASSNSALPERPVAPWSAAPLESLMTPEPALRFLNLADGDRVATAQIAIQVQGPLEGVLGVFLNDVEVPATRVGKRIEDGRTGVLGLEYIGVSLGAGENRLRLVQSDAFGNARGATGITVTAPGNAVRLDVLPERDRVAADGRSRLTVEVRLADGHGTPVTARTPVTLTSAGGSWAGEDLDPGEPGYQGFIENGAARFDWIAPTATGSVRITATSGSLEGEAAVAVVPDLRPLTVTGLLEGRLDLRSFSLDALVPSRPDDGFETVLRDIAWETEDGEVRGGVRGAVYLKGTVRGSTLLTLVYDSENDPESSLFRDIRPDAFYPVYGSESIRGFDGRSTSRLFVRLDRGTSYLLHGDFSTASADPSRSLGAYRRSLTGILEHYETDRITVDAFASRGRSRRMVDEFEALGISGPYPLGRDDVVLNSETVELITRDRNQPDLVLDATALTRYSEYTLDPFTGEILFRRPVPSLDAGLNPISIRVTYEVRDGGEERWVSGVDARIRPVPGIELGGSHVRDDDPSVDRRQTGAHGSVRFGRASLLVAEFARVETEAGVGEAERVELRHRGDRVSGRAFATRSDPGFRNDSAGLAPNRVEAGGKGTARLGDATRVQGELVYTEDRGAGSLRRGAYLGLERRLRDAIRLELGARYAEDAGRADSSGTRASRTSLRAKLGSSVPHFPRLNLYGVYEQALENPDRKLAAAGGEYQILDRGRLYARHEFLTGLDTPYSLSGARRHATVVGLDTEAGRGSHVFSEYRASDAISGRDAEAALGLRNRWFVGRGVWLNTSFERVHVLGGARERESTALGAGVELLESRDWKGTARIEHRRARDVDNVLGTIGVARRLGRTWTLLARNVVSTTMAETVGENRIRDRFQIGLAMREAGPWRIDLLTRYEFAYEEREDSGGDTAVERRHLGTFHAAARPGASMTLEAWYTGQVLSVSGVDGTSFSHLLGGRVARDLADGWDLGLTGHLLGVDGFSSRRAGGGVELGRVLARDLWVSLGYNVFGFEDDVLHASSYSQRGGYLRLRFKFDETLLGAGGGSAR